MPKLPNITRSSVVFVLKESHILKWVYLINHEGVWRASKEKNNGWWRDGRSLPGSIPSWADSQTCHFFISLWCLRCLRIKCLYKYKYIEEPAFPSEMQNDSLWMLLLHRSFLLQDWGAVLVNRSKESVAVGVTCQNVAWCGIYHNGPEMKDRPDRWRDSDRLGSPRQSWWRIIYLSLRRAVTRCYVTHIYFHLTILKSYYAFKKKNK